MKMSLFEYKMTGQDRKILAATAANNDSFALLQRRMAGTNDPRPVPRAPFFEGDDLLFDNVPV